MYIHTRGIAVKYRNMCNQLKRVPEEQSGLSHARRFGLYTCCVVCLHSFLAVILQRRWLITLLLLFVSVCIIVVTPCKSPLISRRISLSRLSAIIFPSVIQRADGKRLRLDKTRIYLTSFSRFNGRLIGWKIRDWVSSAKVTFAMRSPSSTRRTH